MHYDGNPDKQYQPIHTPVDDLNFIDELDFKKILKNPIMDIAARFWENERYDVFKIGYRSMRIIDDLVDNTKSKYSTLSETEKKYLTSRINDWIQTFEDVQHNDANQTRLLEVLKKFHIPLMPWRKLADSMIYDVHHNGFSTFQDFLTYSEGAAVAPGSLFTFMCGVKKINGKYYPPPFDAHEVSRSTARYCYLIHIIRDFRKDQNENLNYFSDDLMAEYGLNTSKLRDIAVGGKISTDFRRLMERYVQLARGYGCESRDTLAKISTFLEPRYLLSLTVLHSLYDQILERVDVLNGRYTVAELNPSPKEIDKRIKNITSSFKNGTLESEIYEKYN
jgi:phytoene/squalene synthetase